MFRSGRLAEWALFLLAALFAYVGYGRGASPDAGYQPGERDSTGLRIVTWNVGGKAESGGRPMDDAWIPDLAETLRRLDPDLAFLQEVGSGEQLDRLKAKLGGHWRGALSGGADRRVAILVQRGSIRFPGFGSGWRDATIATTYRLPGRPWLAVAGLHADAYSAEQRNRQIGKAVDRLMGMTGVGGRLLAGDLNLDLDLDKRRDLFSNNQHLDVESYNYIADRLFDVGVGQGSTAEPDRRLDYIFVSPKLAVIGAGPWKGRRLGSMDHDPVVADLKFLAP